MKALLKIAFLAFVFAQVSFMAIESDKMVSEIEMNSIVACKDCDLFSCKDCKALLCKDCEIFACKDCK